MRAAAGKASVFRNQVDGREISPTKLRRLVKEYTRRELARPRTMEDGTEGLKLITGSSALLGNNMWDLIIITFPWLDSVLHGAHAI